MIRTCIYIHIFFFIIVDHVADIADSVIHCCPPSPSASSSSFLDTSDISQLLPTLREFLYKLVDKTRSSPAIVLTALVYLVRLKNKLPTTAKGNINKHCLLTISHGLTIL